MKYHKRYYQRTTNLAVKPYEIIRILLLNALSAAGGNTPLDDKYDCLNYFTKRIESLKKEKGKFSFKKFAECFIKDFDSPHKITQFRKELSNNSKFRQIGDKKASLFLLTFALFVHDYAAVATASMKNSIIRAGTV